MPEIISYFLAASSMSFINSGSGFIPNNKSTVSFIALYPVNKINIETIKLAKEIGLDVCSGGIIGLGETWEDRIDMAFTLKDLNVDSIPINILTPIKGTPLGDMKLLDIDEILKTIAIYRIINKNKNIRIAAGRETRLKDFMGMAFMAGANGMLVGGYLTTKGRSLEDDVKFADDITKLWEQCID